MNENNDNLKELFTSEVDSKSFLVSLTNKVHDPKKALGEFKKLLKVAKDNIDEMLIAIRLKEHEQELEAARNTNDLVCYAQAALELDVHPKTLLNYIVKFEIEPVRLSKNKVAITRLDLNKLKSKKNKFIKSN